MKAASALALALLVAPASAQTPAVNQARAAGVAGERFDGYMGFAAAPSAEVRREVSAINIKRRSLYVRLAGQKGVTLEEVGITAGCQLLARVQPGQAYYLADGVWRRRAPGAPAPVPDYCR